MKKVLDFNLVSIKTFFFEKQILIFFPGKFSKFYLNFLIFSTVWDRKVFSTSKIAPTAIS